MIPSNLPEPSVLSKGLFTKNKKTIRKWIAPSARQQGGDTAVLFKPNVLADPKVLQQLHYQLTPDTMMVDVRDADSQQTVLSIDGAKWGA